MMCSKLVKRDGVEFWLLAVAFCLLASKLDEEKIITLLWMGGAIAIMIHLTCKTPPENVNQWKW